MTFYDAVQWFKGRGAAVEPGPRIGEVTLTWETRAPDGTLEARTEQVVPDHLLPEMAAISHQAVIRNQLNGWANGSGPLC